MKESVAFLLGRAPESPGHPSCLDEFMSLGSNVQEPSYKYIGVEPKNRDGIPPNPWNFNRVFHEINHPFWVFSPPFFGSTPKCLGATVGQFFNEASTSTRAESFGVGDATRRFPVKTREAGKQWRMRWRFIILLSHSCMLEHAWALEGLVGL